MRRDGTGPAYSQRGGKRSRGVNQKCFYQKDDLLSYQLSQRVPDAMAAAVRRGQAFLAYVDPTSRRSVYELITERPFYIMGGGIIERCADHVEIDTVVDRLGSWEIDWLSPIAACSRSWASGAHLSLFAAPVRDAAVFAATWGLYISTSQGTTSIGIEEPALFCKPGVFSVRPDGTLYCGAVQTMPVARPHFDELLAALDFALAKNDPARGECIGNV